MLNELVCMHHRRSQAHKELHVAKSPLLNCVMYNHSKFDSFQTAGVDSPSSLTPTGTFTLLPFFPPYRGFPHVMVSTRSLRWVAPKLLRPLLPKSELVGDMTVDRPASELVGDKGRLTGLAKPEAADPLADCGLFARLKGDRPRADALRDVVLAGGGFDTAGDMVLAAGMVVTGTGT